MSLGIYLGLGMSGGNWGEVVDELRPGAAAPAAAGNVTNLARDYPPISDAGAAALAPSSAL